MTSLPEVFKLNVFCLFEIFKQIKMNCETSKSLQNRHKLVQYSDLINFVICHEVFTKAFEEWSHSLYKFLEIDYAFLNTSNLLKIDFAQIYETLKKVSKTDRELFWKFCANAIEENELLSSVTLIYHPTRFYPDHLDSFEAVVNSLKNKKSLRTLIVDVSGYSLPYVPCITTLTKLELNVRMEIEDLLQFCQSNPNLRFLNFHHTELQGRLSDILPYCNKLNTLALTMKPDIDASEYADVAKLTQLRQLRLKGVHQEGTLLELLMGLKLKRLITISIPNSFLTKEESLAVSEISSLTSVMGSFKRTSSITDMARLKNLTLLSVKTQPNQLDAMEFLVPFLSKSRIALISDSCKLLITHFEKGGILRIVFRNEGQEFAEVNASLIAPLCQLPNIRQLIVYPNVGSTVWQTLLSGFARQKPQLLSHILFRQKTPISCEEADSLANIRSLRTINCDFCHMDQIIRVKLQQLVGIPSTTSRVDRIKTELCEVHLIHDNNDVALILDFISRNIKADIFAPLFNIKNMRKLTVIGSLNTNFLSALLRNLVLSKHVILEEFEISVVDPEELRFLTQISSLKILKCGFFCSRNLEILGELEHLESLTINVHPKGSLTSLFQILGHRNVLKSLVFYRRELTSEEVSAVLSIKSLEKLQLGRQRPKNKFQYFKDVLNYRSCRKCRLSHIKFSSDIEHDIHVKRDSGVSEADIVSRTYFYPDLSLIPKNLKLLANLPHLKELHIHVLFISYCIENLINALVNPSHQKLRKLSLTLCPYKVQDFTKLMMAIASIALLTNLNELYIENPEGFPLHRLLDLIKTSVQLKSLTLKQTLIDYEASLPIGKMIRLEKLIVGFSSDASIEVLAQLSNLEDLELSSIHNNIENSLRPIFKSCSKLKSLLLPNDLSSEFIEALLVNIKLERDAALQPPLILYCPRNNSLVPEKLESDDAAYLNIEQAPDEMYHRSNDLELHAFETLTPKYWW
ncbi:uncharacterized protein LOC26536221 [Drosophila yakuba]|uniref:Uncharacterized protein n=1 Tax=Drosophila yakuba TaxID=7245 RepID=A0A0R1DXI7_DROYA|nr:uncharacterized protein LOC26536221 [Drosophila yakuba]KRK01788.1 uncharacterized protein Dyak_GE29040 [Drosophila yakuba]